MIREVTAEDLMEKWSAPDEPWVHQVSDALIKQGLDKVVRLSVVPAADLHRIYSVRLAAQHDGAGPRADNLDRFVQALEQPGEVELFSVETSTERWIVILRDGVACSYVRIQSN
jgi:hypothetical protein